jgi:hypothetical protein
MLIIKNGNIIIWEYDFSMELRYDGIVSLGD